MNGAFDPKRYEFPRNSFIMVRRTQMQRTRRVILRVLESKSYLLALFDRDEIARGRTREELPRPADLLLRIGDELVPLRDPADSAREREDRGKHRDRYAE